MEESGKILYISGNTINIMKKTTKFILAEIDNKGRILIPKTLRRHIGITDQVIIEEDDNKLIIKAAGKGEDPIKVLSSIAIKTKKTPVEMKREAEEVFGA